MCVAFSFILQAQVDKERERKHCIPSAPCAIQRTERSGCGRNAARWLPCTGGGNQSTVHHLSKQADADPPSLLLFPQQRSLQEYGGGGMANEDWDIKGSREGRRIRSTSRLFPLL